MKRIRMFRKGNQYQSIEDFIHDYTDYQGSKYVYWNDKLMHINFAAAMRLSSLMQAVQKGTLWKAVRN